MPDRVHGVISSFEEDWRGVSRFFDSFDVFVNVDVLPPRNDNSIQYRLNPGHSLRNFMEWILKNYDSLPERVAFVKSNIVPRHVDELAFRRKLGSQTFLGLWNEEDFRSNHYQESLLLGGGYLERNNSWYFQQSKEESIFENFDTFCDFLLVHQYPRPKWITFSPGACYLTRRENILRAPRGVYEFLRDVSSYKFFPKEAFAVERVLQTVFSSDVEFHPRFYSGDWLEDFSTLTPKAWSYKRNFRSRLFDAVELVGVSLSARVNA